MQSRQHELHLASGERHASLLALLNSAYFKQKGVGPSNQILRQDNRIRIHFVSFTLPRKKLQCQVLETQPPRLQLKAQVQPLTYAGRTLCAAGRADTARGMQSALLHTPASAPTA